MAYVHQLDTLYELVLKSSVMYTNLIQKSSVMHTNSIHCIELVHLGASTRYDESSKVSYEPQLDTLYRVSVHNMSLCAV